MQPDAAGVCTDMNATLAQEGVGFSVVAWVTATSVLKLILAGGASAITFRRLKAKKMGERMLKEVGQLNKDMLLPMMIFTRVADGLTFDLVRDLAFVPILVLGFLASGFVVGLLVASQAPKQLRMVVITVCVFSNVIGLPLPLLVSVIDGLPTLRDDPTAQSRGASYLFLCNVVMSTLMWTMAGRMLSFGR